MTQEEKAQRYDEAIIKVKALYGQPLVDNTLLETIFPELQESEDEKIRKAIHIYLDWLDGRKDYQPKGEYSIRDMLAWLEKQKPIILTGDDLSTLKNWVGYIQDKASELELNDWFVEATEKVVNKMKTLLIQHPNIIPKEMDVDDTNFWLEKQGEQTNLPKFTFDDVLALQCCMETVKKVQEDKDLYEKLNDLHGKVYDAYHLEKQGEQKPNYTTLVETGNGGINALVTGELSNSCDYEEKPVGKVEPKFHSGEWITNGDYTWKIIDVKPLDYILQSQDGNIVDDTISHVDEQFNLWTIQDAKPGDVLAYGDNPNDCHVEVTMIFKSVRNEKSAFTHFHFFDDKFRVNDWCDCGKNAHPATKEQRDFLFQKMKDAGYDWDAEKKELKKIEQKSTWSEDDECRTDSFIEKAVSYIQRHWIWNTKMLEDFKNYMKGE